MDYKKTNAPLNTQTRDLISMSEDTGNVYETVCIIAKRSNQIAAEMKHDLEKKLQEFASLNDNLEEISENREQIEISRFYERLPKPTPHRNTGVSRPQDSLPQPRQRHRPGLNTLSCRSAAMKKIRHAVAQVKNYH